jgi:hypothetical protein
MIAHPTIAGVDLARHATGGAAMRKTIGTITILVLALVWVVPAPAQTGERVFDVLTDLLRGGGGNQPIRGYMVSVRDSDFIVRGGDNRTYTISAAGVDRQLLARLQPGDPVKVTVKRGSGDTLVASAVEADNGQPRAFRTVNGAVESLSGGRLQFRTSEGFVVPVDLNQMVGTRPTLQPSEAATLIYEQTGQNPITAVWIDTRPTLGAASPRTTPPSGAAGGGYERIHGFVESIGLGTLTVKTDDGRTMLVDLGNTRSGDVKPGDLVSVVGRSSGDRFRAETVQKD